MNILGFNSTHDASAALVRDGRVVCAAEEERFSRRKHHFGLPENAIRACLEVGGIDWSDVDHVAFYWDPRKGLVSFGWHVIRNLPKSLAYFDHQVGIWGTFRHLPKLFRTKFGFQGRFHFLDHHRNHLASAFWPSPFEEAAALSVDGTGEWDTTVLGHFREGGTLEYLQTSTYPHSLGKLWETLTQFLGFKPNSGEGKLMGLAPYGRPKYLDLFRSIVRSTPEGRLDFDLRYFDYHYGRQRKYSNLFVETFGEPREPESDITARDEDLAFALQAVTEEALLHLARILHERTGSPRLVMAGGVALNSVANGKILRETPFSELFVQPSASDAGAAMGAALRVWHEVLGKGREGRHRFTHSFFGPSFTDEEMEAALRQRGVEYRRVDDAPEVAAERLEAGEILGWFQGRMEYGPRALGNRSILADPRGADTKDVVNSRVKHREGFRPFAPAVVVERADEFFDTGGAEAPFMLKVCDVREEHRETLPAITHVDGTARLQTVRREANPRYYDLIKAFGERTGVPVVLNTSFNIRGEPIVCTPGQAVDCFLGTGIDTLILGDFVATKGGESGPTRDGE